MINALSSNARKAPPSLKALLSWGAIGAVLVALLVASVSDMNRMGLIMLITVPMLTLVVINIEFGIYCLLAYSSVLAFIIRMMPPGNTGPLGIALDVLLLLMAGRLLFDLVRKRDWKIFATPMTVPIIKRCSRAKTARSRHRPRRCTSRPRCSMRWRRRGSEARR